MERGVGTAASGVDEPTNGKGLFAVAFDWGGDLVSGTTDAAGADFELGFDVLERVAEDLKGVFLGFGLNYLESFVDLGTGDGFFTIKHTSVDQFGYQTIVVKRVRGGDFFGVFVTAHGLGIGC
jgi:hypothetical protein